MSIQPGLPNRLEQVANDYFSPGKGVPGSKNEFVNDLVKFLKIVSYFTVVIPLAFLAVKGIGHLMGRVSATPPKGQTPDKVKDAAQKGNLLKEIRDFDSTKLKKAQQPKQAEPSLLKENSTKLKKAQQPKQAEPSLLKEIRDFDSTKLKKAPITEQQKIQAEHAVRQLERAIQEGKDKVTLRDSEGEYIIQKDDFLETKARLEDVLEKPFQDAQVPLRAELDIEEWSEGEPISLENWETAKYKDLRVDIPKNDTKNQIQIESEAKDVETEITAANVHEFLTEEAFEGPMPASAQAAEQQRASGTQSREKSQGDLYELEQLREEKAEMQKQLAELENEQKQLLQAEGEPIEKFASHLQEQIAHLRGNIEAREQEIRTWTEKK